MFADPCRQLGRGGHRGELTHPAQVARGGAATGVPVALHLPKEHFGRTGIAHELFDPSIELMDDVALVITPGAFLDERANGVRRGVERRFLHVRG